MKLNLPSDFSKRITSAFGAKGDKWLSILPETYNSLIRDWNLAPATQQPQLSYNFVRRVVRADGSTAILKIGIHEQVQAREVAGLRQFNGQGAVQILEADLGRCAYLMEDIYPGSELKSLFESGHDEQGIRVCAETIRNLQINAKCPIDGPFKPVAQLGEDFELYLARTGLSGVPHEEVREAKAAFCHLVDTTDTLSLLHADLHHQNILHSKERGWLAIDPKGFIGDPCFEVGAFMRNPHPLLAEHPSLSSVLGKRVLIFAKELGFSPARIVEWSYTQAILASVWASLDHESGWEEWYEIARALKHLGTDLE